MISFQKYVELDEVYGTVKISGKRGRLVQHSPGEVVFVGNKKQAEKNLKQLKKDGGDGYIMQGVTIKVGEKVKGVEEERDYKDEYNPMIDEAVKFQKVTVKDKSGKSHTHGAVRIRPGDTHVAIMYYDAQPATNLSPAVKAHTNLSFGSEKSLEKQIKKVYSITRP